MQAFLSSSHPCGRGLSKENFTKKFYKQSKLGVGAPTQKITKVILQAKQAGVTTNLKRILSHSLKFG
ncbi:nitrogen fixation protein NifR [Staphylococcus haemolyticus]|nr:nitrogen fixation protein NifR [Staphylococcus haemolyticus]